MKCILVLTMTMSFALPALAGNMKFTCKSSDGTVLVTRDKLILIQTDSKTRQPDLIVLNNLNLNTMPEKDEVLEFSSEDNDGDKVGKLRFVSISKRKEIAGENGPPCENGHGAGFSTEMYKAKVQLSLFESPAKSIQLLCIESSYWSGNCNSDEE